MHSDTLSINDQTIAYYDTSGIGPAAVLVHGNSASAHSFRHQLLSPLGQVFRLVAIDLPGHGNSAPASDPLATYTLPGYAKVLGGVVDRLGLHEAVFIGWSLGGHIVLEASADLPKAKGFMIFGTPPLGFPPAMTEAFLPHPAMAAAFQSALAEEQIAAYVAAFFKPNTTGVPEFFAADVRRTDGRAREMLATSIRPNGYRDEIEIVATLQVPIAILHGAQEQLVNEAYLHALSIPTLWRRTVQVIPEAGHAPHWEQPSSFNALLEAFLHDTIGTHP